LTGRDRHAGRQSYIGGGRQRGGMSGGHRGRGTNSNNNNSNNNNIP